jgi:hypothetical protein
VIHATSTTRTLGSPAYIALHRGLHVGLGRRMHAHHGPTNDLQAWRRKHSQDTLTRQNTRDQATHE